MQQALRPYATAGVAIVGASLVAVTPMAIPMSGIHTVRDVALTSGGSDLLTPWIDAFNTASANATTLLNNYFIAPDVGLQQMIANQSGFLQDFFNDPTSTAVTSISQQMQDNLAAVLTGYGLQNATSENLTTVIQHTLSSAGTNGHYFLFQELPSFLPASVNPAEVTPIVDFLASPASGIIMGQLGPDISPWIALSNSISAGDNFNETLANMVGAYFNGATLNLDSLIPAIEQAGFLPQGYNIENLDVAFGGLLTPGSVAVGPYEIGDASIPAVGGSVFNSLGVELTGVPLLGTIDVQSQPIGPIGAEEAWNQTIGALLGSGWDGKGAVKVTPPLAGVGLPTIPTDVVGAGSTAATASTDLAGLWQDIVSAF